MDRSIPTNSKFLEKKWIEKNKRFHYETLKGVRGKTNSSCPPDYTHIKRKAKRDQLLEGNF